MIAYSIPNIIMALAAVIPAVWLLVQVYKKDAVEHEPVGLIVQLVFCGMLSTVGAMITETIGSALIDERTVIGKFLMYFIVVALSEEGFKYLVLKKRTWDDPNFNYQFDGVVYAVAVSMGFALLENIGYVHSYGISTALVRAVTAVPGHACFGVIMGTWYGMARRYANEGNEEKKNRCLKMAVIGPALLHGLYDFIASIEGSYGWIIFIIFVAVMFFYTYRLLNRDAEDDRRIAW